MSVTTRAPISRLRFIDVLRVGMHGLRTRRGRAALSAVGIAIGVASLVAVLGLSESSRSELLDRLDALGTNLLTVQAGAGFGAGDAELPAEALARVRRLPTVMAATGVSELDLGARRSTFVADGITGGLTAAAIEGDFLATVGGTVRTGRWLDDVDRVYPAVVLGDVAAERLGIDDRAFARGVAIEIGEHTVGVVGILDAFPLAADLDRGVFLHRDPTISYLLDDGADLPTTRIYLRTVEGTVEATRDILAETADPETPEEVQVSRPSDFLEAQAAAEDAFASLFVALGAVALLVGGVGIANVMVIAVIERRGEIGLRRAMGAKRGHIALQFMTEAMMLSLLGAVAGIVGGVVITSGYALARGWRVIIPEVGLVLGMGAALLIGTLAGLYPAARAARLSPTEALRGQG